MVFSPCSTCGSWTSPASPSSTPPCSSPPQSFILLIISKKKVIIRQKSLISKNEKPLRPFILLIRYAWKVHIWWLSIYITIWCKSQHFICAASEEGASSSKDQKKTYYCQYLRSSICDHAVCLLRILLCEAHLLQQLCLFLSRWNILFWVVAMWWVFCWHVKSKCQFGGRDNMFSLKLWDQHCRSTAIPENENV